MRSWCWTGGRPAYATLPCARRAKAPPAARPRRPPSSACILPLHVVQAPSALPPLMSESSCNHCRWLATAQGLLTLLGSASRWCAATPAPCHCATNFTPRASESHASAPILQVPFSEGLVALGPRLLLQRHVQALGAVDVAARVLLGRHRRARDAFGVSRDDKRSLALVRPAAHPRARLPLRLRVARVARARSAAHLPYVFAGLSFVMQVQAAACLCGAYLVNSARKRVGVDTRPQQREAAAAAAGAGCRAAGGSGGRRTAAVLRAAIDRAHLLEITRCSDRESGGEDGRLRDRHPRTRRPGAAVEDAADSREP